VKQPSSLAQDQAGEGWGEQKAAANCHETQALSGIRGACLWYNPEGGRGNTEPRSMVSAGLSHDTSEVFTNDNAPIELAVRSSLSGRFCDAGCNTMPLQYATNITDATK
jgi:hypothetical protein